MADAPIKKFIAKREVRNEQIQKSGKPGFSTGKAKLLRQQTAQTKKESSKSTAVNLGGAQIKTPIITNKQPRIGGHAN